MTFYCISFNELNDVPVSLNSSSEDQFLKKLTEITEANLTNEQFGVSELAREMNMSRSNLHRKVILITKISVSQFIRQQRLKKAMNMLRETALTISEIAYNVGFGSVTYFTKCFHDYFGFPPGEVGKQILTENDNNSHIPEKKIFAGIKRFKIPILLGIFSVLSAVIFLSIAFPSFLVKKKLLDKTIAVLPFADYSQEEGNAFIIYGLQEEILDRLEKINDLEVKSRTDVEKYRGTKLSISQIAKELKVNYVLEGSAQKIKDKIRIRYQLINAISGNHELSRSYEKELDTDNVFDIMDDVALAVANELKGVLTPEEKKKLSTIPSNIPAAYRYYQQGLYSLDIVQSIGKPYESEFRKTKYFFDHAIRLDPTFAKAYERLAFIYLNLLWYTIYDDSIKRNYLDSGKIMLDKSLLYDPKDGWAHGTRGAYYLHKGMLDEAKSEYDKAFEKGNKYNYGTWEGRFFNLFDCKYYYEALESYYKYMELKPEEVLTIPQMIRKIALNFSYLGYPENSCIIAEEFLKQTSDSLRYYLLLSEFMSLSGNSKLAVDYGLKSYRIDSSRFDHTPGFSFQIAYDYLMIKDYKNAYKFVIRFEKEFEMSGKTIPASGYLGFICKINGQIQKANYHFEEAIKFRHKQIKENLPEAEADKFILQFDLACTYAAMGKKDLAIEYLKMIKVRKIIRPALLAELKYLPMFDSIREEPEFQDVLRDIEAKFHKGLEHTGKLLKKHNDYLKSELIDL